METVVMGDMTQFSLIGIYKRIGWIHCLHCLVVQKTSHCRDKTNNNGVLTYVYKRDIRATAKTQTAHWTSSNVWKEAANTERDLRVDCFSRMVFEARHILRCCGKVVVTACGNLVALSKDKQQKGATWTCLDSLLALTLPAPYIRSIKRLTTKRFNRPHNLPKRNKREIHFWLHMCVVFVPPLFILMTGT
jgi:hypothetical protein